MHPVAAWSALVVASLGVLLGGAELMVVAIALPSIVADFGGWADLGRVSWIVNAYLLAYVIAMPLAGRGADLWGARRLYVVALLLFIIGSAGAGLSRMAGPENGLAWLIGWRVVQGFGGGALVPLSMALASHLFRGRQRSAALGLEGAATYIGMAIGPAYGAWVLLSFNVPIPGLDVASWQWIFLLNVPIGIVTLLLIYVVAGGIETPRVSGRLDLVGAALLSIALAAGIGGITASGANGWGDPLVAGRPRSRRAGAGGIRVVRAARLVAAHRPASLPRRPVQRRQRGQPADRLHAGHRHHRRPGVREPRAVRDRWAGRDRPDGPDTRDRCGGAGRRRGVRRASASGS